LPKKYVVFRRAHSADMVWKTKVQKNKTKVYFVGLHKKANFCFLNHEEGKKARFGKQKHKLSNHEVSEDRSVRVKTLKNLLL